jgi:uncharacterized protein YndB with AHSA1/START domain
MSKKKEFTIERTFRASPTILYNFLTTPSGLVQWFADHVDKTGDNFSFYWNGNKETATIVSFSEEEHLKIQWDDQDHFILYEIDKSEVTGETVLFVTDFAEEDEMDDQIQLWESQLDDLTKCMGG